MFYNANVLFKTKLIDGVSCVVRTVPMKTANKENAKKNNQEIKSH